MPVRRFATIPSAMLDHRVEQRWPSLNTSDRRATRRSTQSSPRRARTPSRRPTRRHLLEGPGLVLLDPAGRIVATWDEGRWRTPDESDAFTAQILNRLAHERPTARSGEDG